MRVARFHGPRDIRLEEIDDGDVGRGQVRVAVEWCGICGTDVHEFVDGPRFIPSAANPHPITRESAPVPMGHEIVGTVAEVGADVVGLAVGDPVAVEPILCCGHCDECGSGAYNLCIDLGFVGLSGAGGGLADSCVVGAEWAHPIGDLDLDVAALAEPAAVAYHAVGKAGVVAGTSVLVLGAGPIGLLALACVRDQTDGPVAVLARSPSKGLLAQRLGADAVLPRSDGQLDADVERLTAGRGFDVVLECAGSSETFRLALQHCRKGGRVVLASSAPEPTAVDVNLIVSKELALIGSIGYCGDFPEAIDVITRRADVLRDLITAKVALDDVVPLALEPLAAGGAGQVKVLVSPRLRGSDA